LYAEIFAKVRSRNAKDTGEYCKYLLDNHDEYRDKVTYPKCNIQISNL